MDKYREIKWNRELEAYRKINRKEVYIPKQEIAEAKISREEPIRFYRDWLMIKIGLGIIVVFIVIGIINTAINWKMMNTTSKAIESVENAAKEAIKLPIVQYEPPKPINYYKKPINSYNNPIISPKKEVKKEKPWNKIMWNGKTCWFREESGKVEKKCED